MGVLDGKSALVTGGSRGIGRAIVERLARDGAKVVFSYAGNAKAAADVELGVARAGGKAHAVQADLAHPDGVHHLYDQAEPYLEGLDILVNNAGTSHFQAFDEVTEEEYDRVMQLNARSVFFAMQRGLKIMRDHGRIINISSVTTVMPTPWAAVYTASKAATESFATVLAQEVGKRGITVNAVSPGATDTDMLRDLGGEEHLQGAAAITPLRRPGTPQDIADVVAFLAGPDGRWVTAQNIQAGGGIA
ncbi:3-oxoacyl-[acyl-carrier protein] reductase [Crossiella equi]|uniref:3-oxoacyl-[acyl-carrier protein] reductase n=1 Tax=Crossiella equi TaxID=130796 RepID=A0ABS5AFV3_9PSEU|nr:SDR family oxidoreductase [Crossiella equi]MBP2475462.1 3-oxoacyl-[acyl-carrier protein] reductase [Crossiella equi]